MSIAESSRKFYNYVGALITQYGNNIPKLIDDSNKQIFSLRRKQTNYFKSLPLNKITTGRFYLINYDFNGSKLYCPIFAIDYRVSDKNKPNLYAINLDYLPFDYKRIYFGKLSEMYSQIFDGNDDSTDVFSENSLPVDFESIYNSLKNNGSFHFSISAFDIKKITECYLVSTNILHVLIFCHMRNVNIALMKETMKQYEDGTDKHTKLKKNIEELEKLGDGYDKDIIGYYKRLKQIESNYKLFDN